MLYVCVSVQRVVTYMKNPFNFVHLLAIYIPSTRTHTLTHTHMQYKTNTQMTIRAVAASNFPALSTASKNLNVQRKLYAKIVQCLRQL